MTKEQSMERVEKVDPGLTFSTPSGVTYSADTYTDEVTGKEFKVYRCIRGESRGESSYILCDRLRVTGVYCDASGDGYGRIVEFRDCLFGGIKSIRLDDALAPDEVAKRLQSAGFRVLALSRQNYKACLAELVRSYPAQGLPVFEIQNQPGWVKGGCCFLMPSGEVLGSLQRGGRSVKPSLPIEPDSARWRASTLEEWARRVGAIAVKSKVMVTAIGFALTGPMLRFANINTCFLHILGESRKGKSNAARAAVSAWGSAICGEEGCGLMQVWNSTPTALERWLARSSNAVLALDELGIKQGREAMDVHGLIYFMSQGTAKGRGEKEGGLEMQTGWRLPVISTGEKDLGELIGGRNLPPGVSGRFAVVNACQPDGFGVFDPGAVKDNEEAIELAVQLEKATQEVYGEPSRAFVQGLVAEIDAVGGERAFSDALQAEITERRHQLLESADSQITDLLQRFALIEAALLRGVKYGALPELFTPEVIHKAVQWAAGEAVENFDGSEKEKRADMERAALMFSQHNTAFDIIVRRPVHSLNEPSGPILYPHPLTGRPAGYAVFEEGQYQRDGHYVQVGAAHVRPVLLYLYNDSPLMAEFLRGRRVAQVFRGFPPEWDAGSHEKGYPCQKRFTGARLERVADIPSGTRLIALKIPV